MASSKKSYHDFEEFGTKSYLPDAIYSLCGDSTQSCNICSNNVWSKELNGYVHDTQRGKVFCPFGTNDSMNQMIYQDQWLINSNNKKFKPNYNCTTWGRAPQLDPRPLTKIGLSWRTS